jgi:hypothetical protein
MKQLRTKLELVGLTISFLVMGGSALAQSGTEKPKSGVQILKLKWEKQIGIPRNFDPSVIPTNGVFTNMESRTAVPGSTQAPLGDEARREAANRSAALAPVDSFPSAPSRIPVYYLYTLTIRNVGIKSIKAVAWDYLFLDPISEVVIGEHHLLSYAKVSPEHSVTLKASQRMRPLRVLPATTKAKDSNNSQKPLQRGIVQCVLYEDGTTWQNPATDYSCEILKNSQRSRPRS